MGNASLGSAAASIAVLLSVALGMGRAQGLFASTPPAGEAPDAMTPVTVAQLTEILGHEKARGDTAVAKEIDHLQLTERLSSGSMTALIAELPGARAKAALMAVGDASVFLDPPKSAILDRPEPALAEQKQIVSRAVDYLKEINPKLPDFYARRITTSFQDVWTPKGGTGGSHPGALHPVGKYEATVYYRGGKEIVRANGTEEYGLITSGTFGPILSTAVVDAAHGSMHWARWEEGQRGPMAVFRFQVPQRESHYEVSAGSLGGGEVGTMQPSAYHGEMAIDPTSGTILQLMLEADPELGSSMRRADIMVEYGPVVIGEKTYTCPRRSVSISTGESSQSWTMSGPAVPREVIRLNDVVFTGYHVFRTEMRIIPD